MKRLILHPLFEHYIYKQGVFPFTFYLFCTKCNKKKEKEKNKRKIRENNIFAEKENLLCLPSQSQWHSISLSLSLLALTSWIPLMTTSCEEFWA